MAINRLHLLVLPVAMASLAMAACGGESPASSGGDDRTEVRDATLDFAECMRENGVDMPDPAPGGPIKLGMDGNTDQATLERAQKACQKHLEKVRPPELSPDEQREFREQMLKHARCMREHGIDVPDPTFGEGGTVKMRIPDGTDPEDPRFREAQQECARYGPKFANPE